MTGLYLDAYSGISGDMFLGALLDLGVPHDHLAGELEKLALPGWRLEGERVEQHGVNGTRARVHLVDVPQPHRHLSDIREIIQSSSLSSRIQEGALGVFDRLAHAEARVHGTGVEEVHFHEVGAVDAIVDIVGACIGLQYLGVSGFTCSPLPLGTGFVRAAHGTLPVPAPATLEILTASGAAVLPGQGEGEMVTPTGAALVAHFGRFKDTAVLHPVKIGYGFGTRALPWPNALRAVLTKEQPRPALETDTVTLLECNVDDMSAEIFPYVIERLLERGALDAWTTPGTMKKGRPAAVLSVLVNTGDEERFADILLRETTTLGVRYIPWRRFKADREMCTVHTQWGEVRVKLKLLDGEVADAAPEYEDCARLAREHDVPLRAVYEAAANAARQP